MLESILLLIMPIAVPAAILGPLAIWLATTPGAWARATALAAFPTLVVLVTINLLDFHLEAALAFTCLFALFGAAGSRLVVLADRAKNPAGRRLGWLIGTMPFLILVVWALTQT